MERNAEQAKELERGLLRDKIIGLVSKIGDLELLRRIYRFVKYIYIHKD